MARNKGRPEEVIGFRIEHVKPEDDPTYLAKLLAEAYTNASRRSHDVDTHRQAAQAERQKGNRLQDVIFQLRERKRKGITTYRSRMDPMRFYDLHRCEEQLQKHQEQAAELTKLADQYQQEADGFRNSIVKIEKQIRLVRLRALDA